MVDGDAHIRLWKKIQDCRVGLLQWNRVEFEQPRREIKQLEERYAHLEGSELDATTHQEMMNIKARLAENEVREMLRWQQRSKEHWLANGDGNTRFFHSQASAHKRFKTITKLKNSEGMWTNEIDEIQTLLLQHFRSTFAFLSARESCHRGRNCLSPNTGHHGDEFHAYTPLHGS
ncbi:UNVERIFIED_CONTAM: hypothetical protein Sradi_4838200 [Sesamum radiatum]|uniref:Uncharacterized protein n=1 Tax=Sesamum radiatum TaxID=300843 RepID=A0AAW2N082_SESRA